MLFTYKNCGCCKKEMTNIKVLLNNIFPAGICDEICNYNLHCSKCKELNDKENKYIDQKYRYNTRKSNKFLQNTNANTNLFIQHQPSEFENIQEGDRQCNGY